jgi:hypothetical protein
MRIERHKILNQGMVVITIPSSGGEQEMRIER